MSTRFMTMMLMGISGLAFSATTSSAGDVGQMVERARFNVAYQSGGGFPDYTNGYGSPYGPQYQSQWTGYTPYVPTRFNYGYGYGYGGGYGRHYPHYYGGGWSRPGW